MKHWSTLFFNSFLFSSKGEKSSGTKNYENAQNLLDDMARDIDEMRMKNLKLSGKSIGYL